MAEPARPAPVVIDPLPSGIWILRVDGVLDSGGAARLLRAVDAQLSLARSGHRRLDAVVVDVSGLQALQRGGPEAFEHARFACARLNVEFLLVGDPDGVLSTSLTVCRRLAAVRKFPTLDAAVAAVAGGNSSNHTAGSATGPVRGAADDPAVRTDFTVGS